VLSFVKRILCVLNFLSLIFITLDKSLFTFVSNNAAYSFMYERSTLFVQVYAHISSPPPVTNVFLKTYPQDNNLMKLGGSREVVVQR
jgi:hypothetical protein